MESTLAYQGFFFKRRGEGFNYLQNDITVEAILPEI